MSAVGSVTLTTHKSGIEKKELYEVPESFDFPSYVVSDNDKRRYLKFRILQQWAEPQGSLEKITKITPAIYLCPKKLTPEQESAFLTSLISLISFSCLGMIATYFAARTEDRGPTIGVVLVGGITMGGIAAGTIVSARTFTPHEREIVSKNQETVARIHQQTLESQEKLKITMTEQEKTIQEWRYLQAQNFSTLTNANAVLDAELKRITGECQALQQYCAKLEALIPAETLAILKNGE